MTDILTTKDITDWYLPVNNIGKGTVYPGNLDIDTNDDWMSAAKNLVDICEKDDKEDFAVSYNGIKYRAYRMNTIDGKIYKLRSIPNDIFDIEKLGLNEDVLKYLRNQDFLSSGLILICGGHGQGKSTTCASIVNDRLVRYGGVCIAIEDPPEFPLNGKKGLGHCYQIPVQHNGFAHAIRGAMRSYPVESMGILMIGEIRDAETAAETLRACLNGRLVIATIHSNSVIDSLIRIESLASMQMGSSEARAKLSSGFRGCIFQRLVDKKRLRIDALFATQPTYSLIKDGKYDQLGTEKQRQTQLIKNKVPINLKMAV